MITFHPSVDGSADYLNFHTPDGARFYLRRDEARALAHSILATAAEDVVCEHCGRLNGVHEVRNDKGQIQWCDAAPRMRLPPPFEPDPTLLKKAPGATAEPSDDEEHDDEH